MAEFCKCGSLVIGGRCSNKGCTFRSPDRPASDRQIPVKAVKKSAAAEKTPSKGTKTRRASKCITYNLYETKSEEGGSE